MVTDEQVERATQLWREGKSLGRIADDLDVSVYDLSPWLYEDDLASLKKETE